jgi:MerR family transcriptional regulator, light-induced transcriptional regulator
MSRTGIIGDQELSRYIEQNRTLLVETIVDRLYALYPSMQQRYGKVGRQKCIEDTNYHLMYLTEALAVNSPRLFADYVDWVKALLAGLNIPAEDLAGNLQVICSVLLENAPENTRNALETFITAGLAPLSADVALPLSFLSNENLYGTLALEYLQALLDSDRRRASHLILDAVQAGVEVKDLYLHVFQRSQYELGRLWHLNKITIAHEHYCTAATQMIMSQLFPHIAATRKNGRRMVAASVSGELHELGIRMVADFFEMAGWDTLFLGANSPVPAIVKLLIEHKADVLAISATMTFHISRVAALIDAVRAAPECRHVKIFVGGHPFNIAPDLWEEVGADAYGRDPQEAVERAEALFADAGHAGGLAGEIG